MSRIQVVEALRATERLRDGVLNLPGSTARILCAVIGEHKTTVADMAVAVGPVENAAASFFGVDHKISWVERREAWCLRCIVQLRSCQPCRMGPLLRAQPLVRDAETLGLQHEFDQCNQRRRQHLCKCRLQESETNIHPPLIEVLVERLDHIIEPILQRLGEERGGLLQNPRRRAGSSKRCRQGRASPRRR